MLTTLLDIANSKNPSELAESIFLDITPQSIDHPDSPPSILFLTERPDSAIYENITLLMPFVIKHLELTGQLKCQSLRSFFKFHMPQLKEQDPWFVTEATFKEWFRENQTIINNQSSLKKTKKNKKQQNTESLLEKACKTYDVSDQLYKEFCSLAPWGAYENDKEEGLSSLASRFEIEIYPDVKKEILRLLADYRAWLVERNFFDPKITDLTTLRSSAAISAHYTHAVLDPSNISSPNLIRLLHELSDEIHLCVAGAIPNKIKVPNISRLLRDETDFSTLPLFLEKNPRRKKYFSAIVFMFLSKMQKPNDLHNYLERFIKNILHSRHVIIFSALLECINWKNPLELIILEGLLGCLGDEIESMTLTTKAHDPNNKMLNAIADSLFYAQQNNQNETTAEKVRCLIFSLTMLLISQLLKAEIKNCAMYFRMMRIIGRCDINCLYDLEHIYNQLFLIHDSVFMLDEALLNQQQKNIYVSYSNVIEMCITVKNFTGFYSVVIEIFNLLTERHTTFSSETAARHLEIYAEIYGKVWLSFAAEMNLSNTKKIPIKLQFFNEIFDFNKKNPVLAQWPKESQNIILNNMTAFFSSCIDHAMTYSTTNLICVSTWEKLAALFTIDIWNTYTQIQLIISEISVLAAQPLVIKNDSQQIREKLQCLYTLVDQINPLRKTITLSNNANALYAQNNANNKLRAITFNASSSTNSIDLT